MFRLFCRHIGCVLGSHSCYCYCFYDFLARCYT